MDTFSANEYARYTRHIQLSQVGAEGQTRLKKSHVLMIGCGGLGAPVSLYLAAAGVGKISLVDGDTVELSNLQRQVTFTEADIGHNKAQVSQRRLQALNSDIEVVAHPEHLNADNAQPLIQDADMVLDCTDNFTARYLINDTCARLQKPWVFASIHTFSGQCALFDSSASSERPTACFRCLFPTAPSEIADCNTAGVIGVLPGLLGMLEANEAIKYLLGLPTPLRNNLLMVDAVELSFKSIRLARDPNCPSCQNPGQLSIHGSAEEENPVCSADSSDGISAEQFTQQRASQHSNALVLDVRTDAERQAFSLGGQHIPLAELADRIGELDLQQTIYCYCQSGARSAQAVELLRAQGAEQALNVLGGLAAVLKLNS